MTPKDSYLTLQMYWLKSLVSPYGPQDPRGQTFFHMESPNSDPKSKVSSGDPLALICLVISSVATLGHAQGSVSRGSLLEMLEIELGLVSCKASAFSPVQYLFQPKDLNVLKGRSSIEKCVFLALYSLVLC